jgi:tripartite ATP-independent transporter DctM subunit
MIGLIMFAITLILLMVGFPVAFTFAGVAVIFGVLTQGVDLFAFMPYRIMSIMQNTILMAVPLFVFMGVVLQKTKLAEQLLEAMGDLFGNIRGGLAVSTILVGSLLAASTGVVGASVVAMGVISLPVMLKHNYKKTLSTGVICASGTLGQIIPPSIVLIILADVLGVPAGDLFKGAVMPSLILVGGYSRSKEATAPIAADSVGVAMPEKIEPSTAMMSAIGGTMALATAMYFFDFSRS